MLDGIFIYPILTAVLYYLGARAIITQPLWSRYPPWLDHFLNCAACSGFWYGAAVATIGHVAGTPFLINNGVVTVPVVAFMSIWWTPILANIHDRAMRSLGGEASVNYPDVDDRDESSDKF